MKKTVYTFKIMYDSDGMKLLGSIIRICVALMIMVWAYFLINFPEPYGAGVLLMLFGWDLMRYELGRLVE